MKQTYLFLCIGVLFCSFHFSDQKEKRTEEEAKTLAELVYQRLMDGEDFCAMVMQYSEDPGSKNNCGNVGWVRKGMLVKEYEEVAYRMRSNDIPEPVKSQFGYHIIQLLGRKALKCNTRHILITFN